MGLFRQLLVEKLIGLDIGTSAIKAVELTTETPPRLVAYQRIPLPPGTISPSGLIVSNAHLVSGLKKIFSTGVFSSKNVAVNLPNFSAVLKKATIPGHEEISQSEWLKLIHKVSPFPVSEITFDYQVLKEHPSRLGHKKMQDVLLVIAKKQQVQQIKDLLAAVGIKSFVVDHQNLAVGNSFFFNYPTFAADTGRGYVILDFGAGSTKIMICEHGRIIFSEETKTAGNHCTEMLSDELGIPLLQAESVKLNQAQHPKVEPLLNHFLEKLSQEILEVVTSHIQADNGLPLNGIFLCGGGSQLTGMEETLYRTLQLPIQTLNPLKHVVGTGERMGLGLIRDARIYATAGVGLAFRQPGDKKKKAKRASLK